MPLDLGNNVEMELGHDANIKLKAKLVNDQLKF